MNIKITNENVKIGIVQKPNFDFEIARCLTDIMSIYISDI